LFGRALSRKAFGKAYLTRAGDWTHLLDTHPPVWRSLPETAYEQIRHWRGKSVEFPIEEQRALLAEYYERFERLAELICDAAFAGEGAPFQQEYAEARRWLLRAYPHLKPYLTAHLNCDPSDAEFGKRTLAKPPTRWRRCLSPKPSTR
jgi:hypothetical protein